MPEDRKIFKTPVSQNNPSQWICPTCQKGVLKVDKNSFHSNELKASRDAHSHDDWDPEWIEYTYSCLMTCTNPQCKQVVSSSGSGSVDIYPIYDSDGNPSAAYEDIFTPKFFYPNLILFMIPNKTPQNIKDEINKSFSVFFASPSAAANHVRNVSELLLNHLRIKRFDTNKKGKRFLISLHQRIQLLPKRYESLQELFFAIKWLGNTGSHTSKISIDDIMDSYDILEIIISELFESQTKSVAKLAKKINKTKGPKK